MIENDMMNGYIEMLNADGKKNQAMINIYTLTESVCEIDIKYINIMIWVIWAISASCKC